MPNYTWENLPVPTWEELFFKQVYLVASKSKSITTKIGAILVNWEEKDIFSYGFNGLPRGVNDEVYERVQDRTVRSFFDVHAELNAILNCARKGRATCGSFMFTNAMPCSNCAASIIQAGIKKVIFHQQWNDVASKVVSWQKWRESAKHSSDMFREAHIEIEIFNQVLGVKGFLDAKVISI
jgi:dCMP deaminase